MLKYSSLSSRKFWICFVCILLGVCTLVGLFTLIASKGDSPADEKKSENNTPLVFSPIDLVRIQQKANSSLTISGTIQPLKQTIIRAKVAGEIKSILVREGDSVSAEQEILTFDTRDLEDQLKEKKGQLASSQAQLNWSEKNRATNEALLKQGFISSNRFEELHSNYQIAQGQLQANEAGFAQTERLLGYGQVRSPLNGMIAKRYVQPGEKVNYDTPLFNVVDLDALELQALVPAHEVPRIVIGAPVTISVDGAKEEKIVGKVARINPSTESGTRSIYLYITLQNKNKQLRGGMFATGQIDLGVGSASVSLPTSTILKTAVQYEAGQPFLWVIENNKLAKKLVQIGLIDPIHEAVELKTPLPSDTIILAKPSEQFKVGRPASLKL